MNSAPLQSKCRSASPDCHRRSLNFGLLPDVTNNSKYKEHLGNAAFYFNSIFWQGTRIREYNWGYEMEDLQKYWLLTKDCSRIVTTWINFQERNISTILVSCSDIDPQYKTQKEHSSLQDIIQLIKYFWLQPSEHCRALEIWKRRSSAGSSQDDSCCSHCSFIPLHNHQIYFTTTSVYFTRLYFTIVQYTITSKFSSIYS